MKGIKALLTSITVGALLIASAGALAVTGKATSGLNLRYAPSSSAKKLASVKKDDTFTVIKLVEKGDTENGVKATDKWYKIKYGNTPGFVIASSVKITEGSLDDLDASSSSGDEDVPDEGDDVIELGDEGDDGDVIILDDEGSGDATLDDGIMEIGDEDVPDEDVPDEGLIDEDVPDEDVPDEDDGIPEEGSSSGDSSDFKISAKTMYATTNVNVRAKPSTSASKTSMLVAGDKVTVVEYIKSGSVYNGQKVSGSWYRSNKGNYVSANYLSAKKPAAASSSSSSGSSSSSSSNSSSSSSGSTSGSGSYVTVKTVTKYSKPLTLAEKKGSIKSGEKVTVKKTYKDGDTVSGMKVTGSWYQLSDGTYIQASGVKKS